jgi:hypothetical protein
MAPVNVLKFPTSSPSDTTPLQLLKNAGYDPSQILGIIGKTEGMQSSCWNSFLPSLSVFSRAHTLYAPVPLYWMVSVPGMRLPDFAGTPISVQPLSERVAPVPRTPSR